MYLKYSISVSLLYQTIFYRTKVESWKLYSEVQCDAVQCSCTNPVTGAPAEPARQFKVAAKDVMVCSGTKVRNLFLYNKGITLFQIQCLIQNENAYKMSEMGIADAGGPACDVFGNYMMVQCGMIGCYCESKDGKIPFRSRIGLDLFIWS